MAVTRYIHSQWKMYFSTIVIQDAKLKNVFNLRHNQGCIAVTLKGVKCYSNFSRYYFKKLIQTLK